VAAVGVGAVAYLGVVIAARRALHLGELFSVLRRRRAGRKPASLPDGT
jgi:hypothetical protein